MSKVICDTEKNTAEGSEGYWGMAVEAAIWSRAAREGPTTKQRLSKALKKAREGSVGLLREVSTSLWE